VSFSWSSLYDINSAADMSWAPAQPHTAAFVVDLRRQGLTFLDVSSATDSIFYDMNLGKSYDVNSAGNKYHRNRVPSALLASAK
jgi:hypothetical protein